MSGEFSDRIEEGLHLSRRIYYGKGVTPPPPPLPEPPPKKSSSSPSPESFLPTAVMAYAAVSDPAVVDNPDVPSYQPYVHSRCEPPALVPLQMLGVEMRVDCWMETAVVTVNGRWRVHCIMASKRCDCCIAVPMGEKGSLLGAEVDITGSGRSYKTKVITVEEANEVENVCKDKSSCFLKCHIYTFSIPQVEGGSVLSVQVSWSQKLLYRDGQFFLDIPFKFPVYVVPVGKAAHKKETILLNVNSGIGGEISFGCTSHTLKVLSREVGKVNCLYEAEVSAWSNIDFSVSYTVSSSNICGAVILQSPVPWDFDERGMFCFYLLPGINQHMQVFRRKVVFVIDISRSMQGSPLEGVKKALLVSLSKLKTDDAFNIIAFNEEINLFSSLMELATVEAISRATQWLGSNLIAGGGTNISGPLKQAVKLLAETDDAIPLIFLATDGSVEDEREICDVMKGYHKTSGSISPRICTFGIGSFCNHYFLQILAQIGKGHYDSVYDTDAIELRMQRLFDIASSITVANVTLDDSKLLHSLELFPCHFPDLTSGSPLIVSGRYKGDFPDSVKVRGTLADGSNFYLELTVQKAKDMPLDKVLARRQIDILTAHAWLSGKKELEEKVTRLSVQTGFPSEYTRMVLLKAEDEKILAKPVSIKEILQNPPYQIHKKVDMSSQKTILLGSQRIGFGNLAATSKNLPPAAEEPKKPEGAELVVKAATSFCGKILDRICCMCFLQACSHLNGQCHIVMSQLCAALACFECISCCCELCECLDL